MKKETYNSLKEKAETLSKLINGGKGSGNFGHGGRPGKVGGSSQSGGSKGQDSKVASSKAKKEKSSKGSKKDSVGPAKIAKKDVQKLLQPDHDRYIREVVDVKYDSDKDRYEAKTVVKFKDGSPNSKESWSTMPGGDPKKSSSWFVDNTPTWLEGLSERIDRAHGK